MFTPAEEHHTRALCSLTSAVSADALTLTSTEPTRLPHDSDPSGLLLSPRGLSGARLRGQTQGPDSGARPRCCVQSSVWGSEGAEAQMKRAIPKGCSKMPYFQTWEEFARAAEKLYLTDPMKVRVVLKYRHCDGNLCIKVTDNAVCLQYKTDQAQDVKKIEKLHGKLMRLMVSKETHSAMETD
uniref:Signal recognition particle 9 kDa protein n=2 Tax=Gobiidae TaxID=8220 RepID=A0AAV2KCJ9_KNICA